MARLPSHQARLVELRAQLASARAECDRIAREDGRLQGNRFADEPTGEIQVAERGLQLALRDRARGTVDLVEEAEHRLQRARVELAQLQRERVEAEAAREQVIAEISQLYFDEWQAFARDAHEASGAYEAKAQSLAAEIGKLEDLWNAACRLWEPLAAVKAKEGVGGFPVRGLTELPVPSLRHLAGPEREYADTLDEAQAAA